MRVGRTAHASTGTNPVETTATGGKAPSEPLCLETQGRQIMAVLVQDVVAEAFRLNLYGAPVESVEKANGAAVATREQVKNG